MSLTHRMKKLGAWQGTFHLVLAGITMGSCSRWPELLQLFLCLRGKQNLLQMQCPLLAMQHPSLFGWDPSWATQHPGRYPWCGLSSPHGGPSFFTPVLSCAPGGFPIWAGDSLLPYYWHNSCLMLWPCPLPGWRLWKEGRRCLHCWGHLPSSRKAGAGEAGEQVKGTLSLLWVQVWLLASSAVMLCLPPQSQRSKQWQCCLSCSGNTHGRQRGAQACWQGGQQAHTYVKIEKASWLLIFCLVCYLKAFLQNCHGHVLAEVQNSLPVIHYDNENTRDIFSLENNTPGR